MECRYHPGREARVRCEKHQIGYCEECLDNCEACTDPGLYCKYREQCIIWAMCRKSEKAKKLKAGRDGSI